MAMTIWSVVKGCVVPSAPLPEGADVEIRLSELPDDIPHELKAEF